MWWLLLSLLAIESVQSATVGYPHGALWTFNPVKSGTINSYLRYLDNYGTGSLASFNNPQPVYAVRQIKYVNSATTPLETVAINNDSKELIKARETYLRAASLQQYQSLKTDIEALKAAGKEPSAQKLIKLQMLEKIAFTSDFSLIADLPELKSTLQELESSLSNQQSSEEKTNAAQNPGEIKTYAGSSPIPLAATIEETPEQKQTHENHLRIYNEQIAHLRQLEAEHQKYVQEAVSKSNQPQSQSDYNKLQIDNAKALAELAHAQEEHFRLWNEAKLRAEEAGEGEGSEKRVYDLANKQQISSLANGQNIHNSKQTIFANSKQLEQQSLQRITSTLQHSQDPNDEAKLKNNAYHPSEEQHVVVDTPEVERARKEHLRIVNEAILELQEKQRQAESIKSDSKEHKATTNSDSLSYRVEQSAIEETAEVKKAREEHLRLVQEANVRAQFVQQQELKYKNEYQTPILKTQYQPQVANVRDGHEADEQNQKRIVFPSTEAQIEGGTSEVQRAQEQQQQAKESSRIFPNPMSDANAVLDYSKEEERLLELERMREAERLQKEQQLLELDRLREVERLAEEKRQMEAELTRLRLEEEQRLEMERLEEEKRLQQEQAELLKQQNVNNQEIVILEEQQPLTSTLNMEQARSQANTEVVDSPQNQYYADNPFLKDSQVSRNAANSLEQSVSEQQQSSLLKTVPSNTYQHNTLNSHHNSGAGGKQQYIKYNYHNPDASLQPADTAAALIALDKATNYHIRAHELALEHLRLARIQNPTAKACD